MKNFQNPRFVVPIFIIGLVLCSIMLLVSAMGTQTVLAQADSVVEAEEVVEKETIETSSSWYTITLVTTDIVLVDGGDIFQQPIDPNGEGYYYEYTFEVTYTVATTTSLPIQFRSANALTAFAAGGPIDTCQDLTDQDNEVWPRAYRCYFQVTPDTQALELKVRWPINTGNVVEVNVATGEYISTVFYTNYVFLPVIVKD